jgi:hypothetical protein
MLQPSSSYDAVGSCVIRTQHRLGFRSCPVADACGAPVLRDQGPDRPAGHGKADASLDQSTTCLQSQIGCCRHLRGWGTAQVVGAVVLSVVVRSGPARTVVNGTLVARPVRGLGTGWCRSSQPDRRARPVLGDDCIKAKPRRRRGEFEFGHLHLVLQPHLLEPGYGCRILWACRLLCVLPGQS